MQVRVAVDAMGGDRAPGEVIAGAREALADDIVPVLFGPREVLAPLAPDLEVVEAPQVVGMHEKPADAAREKRDSSLFRSCKAVAEGNAHVVVSAGNTGAMLAAGLVEIGRLPDVSRPAIAAPIPAMRGPSILIDAGANADARPEHLMQFAHMGTIFAQEIIGIERPNVGLLSIGEEPEKGNRLVRQAHELLAADPDLAFVGNVEGRLLLEGGADVLVCDGFTGNMALKVLEGTIRTVLDGLRQEIVASRRGKAGGILIRPAARGLRKRLDPDTYGGGYLLGLKGLAVVAHGNSSRRAITSAIQLGARGVQHRVVDRMEERLAARVGAPAP
jgi:glycerol-3-phosphate acyltransferase PlsX